MPITRPTTKTIISTTGWGIPITDELNRLTPLVDGRTPTAWVTVAAFTGGWVSFDATRPPQYRKIGDVVFLRGVVKNGAINSSAFTLPAGYRYPVGDMSFIVDSNAAVGSVNVGSNGNVVPGPLGSNAYFRLDTIFYSTLAFS